MSLQVFTAYNRAMTDHGLVPYQSYSKHRSSCEKFVAWCLEYDVDPIRWLLARHEAIQWLRKVPLKSLHSDRFLDKFREWGDSQQAAKMGQDRLAKSAVMHAGPSREMREVARARMKSGDCYLTARFGDRLTFYEETSPTCKICFFKVQCERSV